MRLFYNDEGPIDTLLQIAERPIQDGDLVGKSARDILVQMDWVARCHGWNIITPAGQKAIAALRLCRMPGVAIGDPPHDP